MAKKTGPYLRSPVTIESVMKDVLTAHPSPGWSTFGIRFVGGPTNPTAMVTEMLFLRCPLTQRGFMTAAAVTGVLGLIPLHHSLVDSSLSVPSGHCLSETALWGLGHNIFNPALGARAILLLALRPRWFALFCL